MDGNATQKLETLGILKASGEEILVQAYKALEEKGYNPINQIVGYILSGDPTYITSHKNARALMGKVDRDELLEMIVISFLKKHIS